LGVPDKIITLDIKTFEGYETNYAENFEYESTVNIYTDRTETTTQTLTRLHTPEGYITTVSSPQYHYYRRDHLGNNREVWLANTNTTLQRTQYYPSGLPWAEGLGAGVQNKKYNGKEFVEMHGWDEYDSEARWMYPAIMRTSTLDPLAEKYYSISPYAWCGGNPVRMVDPDGMDWYSYQEEYTDEDGKKQTRTAYKYVEGEMSKKEIEKGGYTHLGKTYDDKKGTYFSLGGSEIKYDKENALSVLAINRVKSADNTIIATINEFTSNEGFWDKYKGVISTATDAGNIIGEFMNLSKGFKGTVGFLGNLNSAIQGVNDVVDLTNGNLKGEKMTDAIVNIISFAGAPGAAMSLTYNHVIKPGAKGITKLEYFLRSYIPDLIIRSNNGMY